MAKRKFQLSDSDRHQLIQAYALCKDGPTRTRYQAVRLYGEGYAVSDIEQITGCRRSSLMEWCRADRQDPGQGLVDKRAGGNCAKLARLEIEAHRLHQYTPRDLLGAAAHSASGQYWTVDDLQAAVRHWYGVEYWSQTSYLHWLALCEFSYQKTEQGYKSHSQLKVADLEEQLEKNGSTKRKPRPTPCFWQTTRPACISKRPLPRSGLRLETRRSCASSLVAPDPFLWLTELGHGPRTGLAFGCDECARVRPILGNALGCLSRATDCAVVGARSVASWPTIKQVLTDNPRLEIICFPAGSLELNPQEHVWKATRQSVSHNHDEPRLPKLAERFETHLTTATFASSFLEPYGYTAIRPMFI